MHIDKIYRPVYFNLNSDLIFVKSICISLPIIVLNKLQKYSFILIIILFSSSMEKI